MHRLCAIACFVAILVSFKGYGKVEFQRSQMSQDSIHFEKKTIYEITEVTQMNFGSSKIHYTVENKEKIPVNDLGPNNVRIVKERIVYRKRKHINEAPQTNTLTDVSDAIKEEVTSLPSKTITIKRMETYERMVESGVQTAEILEELANEFYFRKDYHKAIKYFERLFELSGNTKEENTEKHKQCLKFIEIEKQESKKKPRKSVSIKQH